jgi:hypothetical protein
MTVDEDKEIDIYAIGLLADLRFAWNTTSHIGRHGIGPRHVRQAISKLRYGFRTRTSGYWHGFHAEHAHVGSRCGHGWTQRKARLDLIRAIDMDLGITTRHAGDRPPV